MQITNKCKFTHMVGVKNPSYRQDIPEWEIYLKLKNKGLLDVVITLRCGVTIVVGVPSLMKCLGLKIGQFYELLDFYHAAEHLSKVASF